VAGQEKIPYDEIIRGVSPAAKRTTRARVAEAAGVSEYKAQQGINVEQHGSDDLKQAVRSGKVMLAKAQAVLSRRWCLLPLRQTECV